MRTAAECLARATEMVQLADATEDLAARKQFLMLAEEWTKLARWVEPQHNLPDALETEMHRIQ